MPPVKFTVLPVALPLEETEPPATKSRTLAPLRLMVLLEVKKKPPNGGFFGFVKNYKIL